MAAAVKALNARIRSNKYADYFFSTHFWGPASNFGIPIAAVLDITRKDEEVISGPMTLALVGYSATFMRYAMAVTPRNYLLFGCHVVNFTAQCAQGYRYVQYWHLGGREQRLANQAKNGLATVTDKAKDGLNAVAFKAKELGNEAQAQVNKLSK